MSAVVDSAGVVAQLDGRAEPDAIITAADVQDPEKLARMVARLFRELAIEKRRWKPSRTYYRDIASTGTTASAQTKRFAHGYGGRVNWWICDWKGTGTVAPLARKTTATTSDELVLELLTTGTFTLVIEEAG